MLSILQSHHATPQDSPLAQATQELLFHVRFEAHWTRILLGQYVQPQKHWLQRWKEREGGGQGGECRGNVLVLQPALINHDANPKDSPEHDAMCSPFSITCWFWLLPGTGRVHLAHPSAFTSCLQLDRERADGKLILLYSNPSKAILIKRIIWQMYQQHVSELRGLPQLLT